MLFLIGGFNSAEMNQTVVPYILGHCPAGTSTLNMMHYRCRILSTSAVLVPHPQYDASPLLLMHFSQSITGGRWQGYDWGDEDKNIAR